ncbi:hypothetical protein ACP70R_002618 [Stipagrostis hirtigluma subsp. patula]
MPTAAMPPSISASSVDAAALTGTHVLRIDGFSQAALLPAGKCLKSCVFRVGGHAWRVRCYPGGVDDGHSSHVSVVLELAGGVRSVRAKVRVTLLALPAAGVAAPAPALAAAEYTGTFWMKWARCSFGSLIGRKALEGSTHLVDGDDCVAVRCDITVIPKPAPARPVVRPDELERLGLVCTCKDDLCKRPHVRAAEAADEFTKPGRSHGTLLRFLRCLQM